VARIPELVAVSSFRQLLENQIFPLVGAFPWELKVVPNDKNSQGDGELEITLTAPGFEASDRIYFVAYADIVWAAREEKTFIEFTKGVLDGITIAVRGRSKSFEGNPYQPNEEQRARSFFTGSKPATITYESVVQAINDVKNNPYIVPVMRGLQDYDDPQPIVDPNAPAELLPRPARHYGED
jgi:hypothetical protein